MTKLKHFFSWKILFFSFLFTVLIPYFQPFHFKNSFESITLGWPFAFLSLRKELKGNNFFSSTGIDVGSLLLSFLFFYIIFYGINYLYQWKIKK